MEEEELKALDAIYKGVSPAWGSLRDAVKRLKQCEDEFKKHAGHGGMWADGYKIMKGMKKPVDDAVKSARKIVDTVNLPVAKLEKMGIDEVIAAIKKHDKVVDKADQAIAKFEIWYRKFAKQIEMQPAMPLMMKGLLLCTRKYLGYRGAMNKGIQKFQRLAKV